MLTKIKAAFTETTVAQLSITIICLGLSAYLTATGQVVPDWLLGIDLLVVGFYFGSTTSK